jgi:hypothetical protein
MRNLPPVVVFGLTWLGGLMLATIWLTIVTYGH